MHSEREHPETLPKAAPRPSRRSRLCFAGLAAAIAGFSAPWLTWLWLGFDVFSQFTVHFVILAIACALGALLPRYGVWMAAAVSIAGVLALAGWANTHKSPRFATPPPAGQIRVMTFNTWARNHDLEAIAAEIRARKPDIIGMMEFAPPKQKLGEILKSDYPYQGDCMDKPHCYLGFLSRWPVESVSGRSMWRGPPYLHVIVRAPSGPLHVFVVHTLRFPWLGSQLKQVKAMADMVRKAKGAKIVLGDFNTTPFSIMMRAFIRRSHLRRLTFIPSWPAWAGPLPQLAIDHIFASPELEVASGPWIGGSAGSDHFPVIVTVRAAK